MKKIVISALVASVVLGGLVSSSVAVAGLTHIPASVSVADNDRSTGSLAIAFDIKPIPSKDSNINDVVVNPKAFAAVHGGNFVTTPAAAVMLNFSGDKNLSGNLQVTFTATFENNPTPQPQPAVTGTINVQVANNLFPFIPETPFFNSNHTAACGISTDNYGPSPSQPEFVISCVTLYGKSK